MAKACDVMELDRLVSEAHRAKKQLSEFICNKRGSVTNLTLEEWLRRAEDLRERLLIELGSEVVFEEKRKKNDEAQV